MARLASWPLDAATRRLLRVAAPGRMNACAAEFEVLTACSGWNAVVLLRRQAQEPPPWPVGCWQERLSRLLQDWDSSAGRVLKCSPGSLVFQTSLADGAGQELQVVCKGGRSQGVLRRMAASWRGPKEFREFWAGHRLLEAGVPTPLPLACLWRRGPAGGIEARLVTVYLAEARGLDHTLTTLTARRAGRWLDASTPGILALLSTDIGELVGTLGSLGLYHRDLKASNIMVSREAQRVRPWLIDLDGLQGERRPCGSGFRRSLVRLHLSVARTVRVPRTCRLRALQAALRAASTKADWKHCWRAVADERRRLRAKGPGGKLGDYE